MPAEAGKKRGAKPKTAEGYRLPNSRRTATRTIKGCKSLNIKSKTKVRRVKTRAKKRRQRRTTMKNNNLLKINYKQSKQNRTITTTPTVNDRNSHRKPTSRLPSENRTKRKKQPIITTTKTIPKLK